MKTKTKTSPAVSKVNTVKKVRNKKPLVTYKTTVIDKDLPPVKSFIILGNDQTPTKTEEVPILQYISLADAIKNTVDTQLYVVNNNKKEIDNTVHRGQIVIDISDGSLLVIPDSWLPYDTSMVAPRDEVLKNAHFRKCVLNKMLLLVTTESAEHLLATDDADDERRRLEMRDSNENDDGREDEIKDKNISPNVVEIMNRSMAPRDRLATLKNIKQNLTKDDIHYIIHKAQKGETKLLNWIENIRSK